MSTPKPQNIVVTLHHKQQKWKLKIFKGTPVEDIIQNMRQITKVDNFICKDNDNAIIVLTSYLPNGIDVFLHPQSDINNTCCDNDIAPLNDELKKNNIIQKKQSFTDFKSMNCLREELLDSCDELNVVNPSNIQAIAIPLCVGNYQQSNNNSNDTKGNDLVLDGCAGCGTTVALALIMLSRMDEYNDKLQGLWIVSSRELAIQTSATIITLAQFIEQLDVVIALKGNNNKAPNPWKGQICIGTPGSIIYKYLPANANLLDRFLSDFKILVIDDLNYFAPIHVQTQNTRVSNSLFDQLKDIIELIRKVNRFQTLFASNHFPTYIKKYVTNLTSNATIIRVRRPETFDTIIFNTIICDDIAYKLKILLRIVAFSNVGQMIVFVNTVKMAKYLMEALEENDIIHIEIACGVLYGALNAAKIDKTMQEFRNGYIRCLIASDVILRGVDMPSVGLVVNFEIPVKSYSDIFMQRIVRTGRFGEKGVCINLITKDDDLSRNYLDGIQSEYSLDVTQYRAVEDGIVINKSFIRAIGRN